MKKTIITVALLAVLTSLAVSCQKEEADITSATPSTVIAENDTHRTVVYTIDGVSYRLTLLGDEAWHDFLSRMFALAEEGHSVTSSPPRWSKPTPPPTKKRRTNGLSKR